MAVPYAIPRGTRSNLIAKASAGTIIVGQIYLLTDEARLAVGTSTTTFQTLTKQQEDGVLTLNQTTTPITPSAGLTIMRRSFAGRPILGSVDNMAETTTYQPHTGRNKSAMWNAAGGVATTPVIDGLPPFTALGTATARTPAVTNIATRSRRLGFVSGAATASFAGMYSTIAAYTTGGVAAGVGGFHTIIRFNVGDAVTATGPRQFIGMAAAVAAPSNVEPSAANLPNHIGLAQISTSNNYQMLISGGSSGTLVDLGTSFPASNSAEMYELQIYSPATTSISLGVRVERLSTGAVYELYPVTGTAGTQYPANTTLLAPRMWRTTNAGTTAVALDISSIYIDTDN